MTEETPDFEAAGRAMSFAAERGPNGTLAVGSNEGRAYLALVARIEKLEGLIVDVYLDLTHDARWPVFNEARAILAAREKGEKP